MNKARITTGLIPFILAAGFIFAFTVLAQPGESLQTKGVETSLWKEPSSQGTSFVDLEPGLAAAIAAAMQDDIPVDYYISKTESGYQADNPDHGLQFGFNADGLTLYNPNANWTFGLLLSGWGYQGDVQAVPSPELVADGGRIEFRRGHSIVEWYLNNLWGLEQGFTLESPPAGTARGDELQLEMYLNGTLQLKLINQTTLSLIDPTTGQLVLNYAGLHAYDAQGHQLPARLQLDTQSPIPNPQYPISNIQSQIPPPHPRRRPERHLPHHHRPLVAESQTRRF